MYFDGKRIVPISYMVMLCGTLTVYSKNAKWREVLFSFLGVLAVSIITFSISYTGNVSFNETVSNCFILFYILFLLIIIAINFNKFMPPITEGVVLLQNIALIYWVATTDILNEIDPVILYPSISIGLMLTIFSLYQTLSYEKHTEESRLLLSICSCVIVCIIGFDNVFKVLSIGDIESDYGLFTILNTIQYFILGMSIIYISNSLLVLLSFIKDDKMSENEHKQAIKELKNIHISRVDTAQVARKHTFFILIFTILFFGLNYTFKILPPNFAIWCMFLIVPVLVSIHNKLYPTAKVNTESQNTFFKKHGYFRKN